MQTEMIKQYLATLLRNLLAPVFVWLVAEGYLTDNQVGQLILIIASVVITVVWGLANKYIWKEKAETALELPGGSSFKKLEDVLKK